MPDIICLQTQINSLEDQKKKPTHSLPKHCYYWRNGLAQRSAASIYTFINIFFEPVEQEFQKAEGIFAAQQVCHDL